MYAPPGVLEVVFVLVIHNIIVTASSISSMMIPSSSPSPSNIKPRFAPPGVLEVASTGNAQHLRLALANLPSGISAPS